VRRTSDFVWNGKKGKRLEAENRQTAQVLRLLAAKGKEGRGMRETMSLSIEA
jgi:hypothetical protein